MEKQSTLTPEDLKILRAQAHQEFLETWRNYQPGVDPDPAPMIQPVQATLPNEVPVQPDTSFQISLGDLNQLVEKAVSQAVQAYQAKAVPSPVQAQAQPQMVMVNGQPMVVMPMQAMSSMMNTQGLQGSEDNAITDALETVNDGLKTGADFLLGAVGGILGFAIDVVTLGNSKKAVR